MGLGTSNQEGNFTSFARTNHVHRAFDSVNPSSHGIGQSGAPGTSTIAARRDHVHAIPVGIPVAVGTANAEGSATTAARSDHVHEGDGAGNGGSDLQVADEGSSLTTAATAINFAGAGVTATASGTAVTVTIPGGGGGDATGYTRTLLGTSASMGTTVVTLNLSDDMEDGDLIEIMWLASAGGRNYGSTLISADAILDLTAQTTEPGTVSAAMQFKIGDTATGLNAFGHGSGYLWLIDSDSIYVANGRQRPMVAEVYN